jgi:colicin import membrane protein
MSSTRDRDSWVECTRRKSAVLCVVWTVVAVLAVFGYPALAQDSEITPDPISSSRAVSQRFPAGSIKSEKTADAALVSVAKERAEIEARFALEERACASRFFVTSCVDQAKEHRYQALVLLRPVEIEANGFKRQERALQRDRRHQRRLAEAESRRAAAIVIDRQAQYKAKLARFREQEEKEAKTRAENVAAYEAKVRAVLARQKESEKRNAEKERQRRIQHASSSETR